LWKIIFNITFLCFLFEIGFKKSEEYSQIKDNTIDSNLVFDSEIDLNAIPIITEDALPINSVIAEVDFISSLDENVQSQLFNEISNSADHDNSNVIKEITTGNGKILMFIFFKAH